jgi:hypothetical protein
MVFLTSFVGNSWMNFIPRTAPFTGASDRSSASPLRPMPETVLKPF